MTVGNNDSNLFIDIFTFFNCQVRMDCFLQCLKTEKKSSVKKERDIKSFSIC